MKKRLSFALIATSAFLPSLALAQDLGEVAESGMGPEATIGNLVQISLGFLAVIATIVIIAGGFKWATASDNDDALQEAKTLVFSGLIGLAVILSAWVIAFYVINALTRANI